MDDIEHWTISKWQHEALPGAEQGGTYCWVEGAICDRVEVVPASQLRGAVEALRRIAAGHAHPAKLAGEALDVLPPDDNVYDPPYVERGQ